MSIDTPQLFTPTAAEYTQLARIERIKAAGYVTLTLITSLAIAILCTATCFFGVGFAMAPFYGCGLEAAIEFSVHLILVTAIASPVTSFFPIKFVGGYFFKEALHHWNLASDHYKAADGATNIKI